ncbi:hypothetical protein N5P37_003715 [Trichoderma harzianum]|nr:hypothetical protein N5P37_003715 [Trichoderma harzianum]
MTCLFDILHGRLLYMWYLSAIPNRARQAICRYRGASAHKRRAGEGLPPANGLPLGSTRKPEPQQSRKTATGNRKGSLCSNPTIRMATCQTGGIESQQRSQGAVRRNYKTRLGSGCRSGNISRRRRLLRLL